MSRGIIKVEGGDDEVCYGDVGCCAFGEERKDGDEGSTVVVGLVVKC